MLSISPAFEHVPDVVTAEPPPKPFRAHDKRLAWSLLNSVTKVMGKTVLQLTARTDLHQQHPASDTSIKRPTPEYNNTGMTVPQKSSAVGWTTCLQHSAGLGPIATPRGFEKRDGRLVCSDTCCRQLGSTSKPQELLATLNSAPALHMLGNSTAKTMSNSCLSTAAVRVDPPPSLTMSHCPTHSQPSVDPSNRTCPTGLTSCTQQHTTTPDNHIPHNSTAPTPGPAACLTQLQHNYRHTTAAPAEGPLLRLSLCGACSLALPAAAAASLLSVTGSALLAPGRGAGCGLLIVAVSRVTVLPHAPVGPASLILSINQGLNSGLGGRVTHLGTHRTSTQRQL